MKPHIAWWAAVALLGALIPAAIGIGWLATKQPVGTVLVFAVDASLSEDAARSSELVQTLQCRVGREGRVRHAAGNRIEVDVFGDDPRTAARIARRLSRPGKLEFRILANRRDVDSRQLDEALERYPETGTRQLAWAPIQKPEKIGAHGEVVLDPSKDFVLTVVADNESRVTGAFLHRVSATTDHAGAPALGFELNPFGGYLMTLLTQANQPAADGFKRRLAIMIDGQVVTTPELSTVINLTGIITASFTPEDVEDLAAVLQAGALPVPIHRVDRIDRESPKVKPPEDSPLPAR